MPGRDILSAVEREWLLVQEAARLADVHPKTIERACRSGRLRGELIEGRWFVYREALVELYKAAGVSRPAVRKRTALGAKRRRRPPLRRETALASNL